MKLTNDCGKRRSGPAFNIKKNFSVKKKIWYHVSILTPYNQWWLDFPLEAALVILCNYFLWGVTLWKRKRDEHEDQTAGGSAVLESKTRTIQYDTGQ